MSLINTNADVCSKAGGLNFGQPLCVCEQQKLWRVCAYSHGRIMRYMYQISCLFECIPFLKKLNPIQPDKCFTHNFFQILFSLFLKRASWSGIYTTFSTNRMDSYFVNTDIKFFPCCSIVGFRINPLISLYGRFLWWISLIHCIVIHPKRLVYLGISLLI